MLKYLLDRPNKKTRSIEAKVNSELQNCLYNFRMGRPGGRGGETWQILCCGLTDLPRVKALISTPRREQPGKASSAGFIGCSYKPQVFHQLPNKETFT